MTYDPTAALERFDEKFAWQDLVQTAVPLADMHDWLKAELLLAYKKGREDAVEYFKEHCGWRLDCKDCSYGITREHAIKLFAAARQSNEGESV